MNDPLMFEALPKMVGVANIQHYRDKLSHHPSNVMTQPEGFGFAEFVKQRHAIKSAVR